MSGYLSFRGSGHALVDGILSAIESAGNAFHNTGDWEDNELGPIESSARNAAARIAALEAEVAQLRSGIHPPVNPMTGGFSLENFMPGLKPEDADAFCEALDAASPDLSEKQGTFSDKIAALEAQLDAVAAALAEEARVRGLLVEAMGDVRTYSDGCGCCMSERVADNETCKSALAAADALDKERG